MLRLAVLRDGWVVATLARFRGVIGRYCDSDGPSRDRSDSGTFSGHLTINLELVRTRDRKSVV